MFGRLRDVFKGKPTKSILRGDIYDQTGTCQSACPLCDYGRGYLVPFLCGSYEIKKVTCKICGTEFMAPVTFSTPAGRAALEDE